ncbi:MAG: hypothetical protein KDE68_10430 [Rhodocyclaceae bacterium]|nr:hypothetical protein [Rhodocyclaceae bacterium]
MKRLILSAALLVAISGCASMYAGDAAHAMPAQTRDGMLTDTAGMTLYTFDKDAAGKSACNGPCAANWPPLMAAPGDQAQGDWSVVTRDDGTLQWAHKGKPLYRWIKDQKPGDVTGDGFKNVWHVARP